MSSEEANARALLLEMQARLASGPHVALGLPNHASASDIRSAFLQLTKTFHPARFGRMSNEVQRLSNEVFLALRSAHDALAKPRPTVPTRGTSTTASPANRPATRPFGVPITPATRPGIPSTGKLPAEPRPASFDPPTQPPQRQTQPLPITKPGSPPPANRQPPSASSAPANRPMGRAPTPASGIAIRATPPASSAKTPAPQLTRPSQPGGTIRFPPTAARPTNPTPAQPVQQARPPGSSSSGTVLDRELAPILELMGMGMWDAAQAAIDSLVNKNPQNKRYDALACYSRGRRAQLEGRLDDARVELQRALFLDPELEPAKVANAELFARRR
jgi:hypothetical protein